MNSTESGCVIGPENILFVGVSVYLLAWKKKLQAGALKGLRSV